MDFKLKPLDQQVVVITGASSGIGLATALAAGRKGARVVLAARSADVLEYVVDQIRASGGNAIAVRTDVSKRADLEALAETAVARYGHIDTWINDAGVSIYGRLDEVAEVDSRALFDINFWGVVNGSLIALPYLKRQGGALINLGSEVSDAALPLQGMYSASKHAVKGFNDALRIEVMEVDQAPVSITLIQPTAVDTPYPQHAKNYQTEEAALPEPMIEPEHVAEKILEAATKPMRYVKVGMGAKLDTFMAKFIPPLADKFGARQYGRQHYAEAPRNPEGTLYDAGHEGRVRGTGGRRPSKEEPAHHH